jgi:hypothetical protein
MLHLVTGPFETGVKSAPAAHGIDLGLDVLLILREMPREISHLVVNDEPHTGDDCKGYADGDQNRNHPRQVPAPQPIFQRRQQEAEQNRQRKRNQNLPCPVKRQDNQSHGPQRDEARGFAGIRLIHID